MEKTKIGFHVFGRVVHKESGLGIPGLTVKAVDKDLMFDDVLGTALSDENGAFSIQYEGKDFQELFLDKQPDLYLTIKDSAGNLIFSTQEKVRYNADTTEEFTVEIPKDRLFTIPWNVTASNQLKRKIAVDKKLMGQLTEVIEASLTKYKIDYPGYSYMFEPRIFELDHDSKEDLLSEANVELVNRLLQRLYPFNPRQFEVSAGQQIRFPYPLVGPLDPEFIRILEKHRLLGTIRDALGTVKDDPVPISPSLDMMRRIVGNEALLKEISTAVFEVLHQNGIKFKENQSCVFVPIVFEKPVYAQQVATVNKLSELKGFGPEVVADSNPLPARVADAGLVKVLSSASDLYIPAIRIKDIWISGIPAPEMLRALDVMREVVRELEIG